MISKLTKYIFIVLIFCFGTKNTAFAQVNSYTFSQTVTPGIYAEITSLNTLNYTVWQSGSAIDVNTISAAVPITFNGAQGGFTFNCKTYGDVFINNNGHICFQPWGGLPLTTYNVISSTAYQVEGAISAFGANLVASTAVGAAPSISYGNQGANFIIQYKDVARTATPNDRINFQIWLSANGIIRFIYGQCTADATSTSVAAAIVGMRANHFSDMQNRTVSGTSPTADWLNSAPGTTVTSSCRFTNVAPAAAPINNLVYTYTPSNCVVPTYATIPATVNFENAWIGNTSALPSVHWRNWPARGQGAWFRDDENSVATNNWGSPGSGTYSPSGAAGTSRSARFHCATTPTGTYGDLDYYVDLSGCGTNTKFLNFYYNNELGADYLQVFLSTDGGASFTQLGTNIMAANNANWIYQTINLGTANSNTSVIRFRAFADVVNTEPVASDIGIDEISIGVNNTPPPISISGIGGVCSPGQGAAGSTLLAAGGISYSWSPSIGLNTTTGSTVVSTPTVPTTYTVIGVDAGCNTASSTFMVNISPQYEINFWTQYPNVCVNGTASITISDTINGSSTPPIGYCSTPLHNTSSFCISNVSLGSLNNSSTTCAMPSYTFYNNVAVPVLYGGSNSNISVTLTQSSGAIAVWIDYNRNGIFEPTEYTSITTTSVAGSPAIASINVPAGATAGVTRMRIRSRVAASFITASDACLQFSAGGETEDYLVQIKTVPGNNLNYTWSPSTYLNTTASQSIIATNVASSITYTVNASDAIGCTVSKTVTLNVAPLNCGVITSNPTLLCLGNAATMYANVTGGGQPYAYQWQGPNANNTASIVISSIDSAIVSPVVNTDYTLTVTDACGTTCSTVFTLNVYQGVIPTIVNANGGPIQICGTNANSISLEVSGGTAYTWTPAPTYQSPSGDSVNIVATGPTLYTVVGSSAGCNGSATVTVPFYPNYLLQVTANPASLCTGSITNLKVTDTINGPQVLPSANYCSTNLHSIGGTHCIDTFNINNVNLNAPAGYVCGTNTYSQFLSASATQLIVGQAYPIQASLFQPGFMSMWIDYNRDGSFDPSEYTSLITNSQVASTSIIVPNFSAIGQTIMRLRSSQNPIIPSDYCNSFIYGETKDYIVDISQKSSANITSYSWSPAAAIASNGNANATTNVINSNTNFVVTTTDANGCTKQSGVQVVVSPLTCGNISIAPSSTVCAGTPTTLTANSSGGGAPNTYKWETSAGIIGTTKSIVINPTTTTTYTATITDACGIASTCVNTITVTVLPAPSLTLTSNPTTNNICAGGTATLSVSGAVSYTWAASLNPSNITTIVPTSVSIAPIQSNEYFVVGVGSNGCTSSISRNITYSANLPLVANALFDSLTSCNPSTQLLVTDTAVGGNFINSFPYCSSSANSNTSFDITNVQINTNSSTSVCNTLAPGIGSVTSRYSNYTGTTLTTLFTNVQNVYTVSISDCNNAFVTGGFRIYIDWNANGLFTDAGELVASNSSVLSGNNSNIGTFTIPSFATAGIVRMRVIAFNGNATGASCGTYAEGETEDYAVEIRRVPQLPYTFTWQPGAITGNAPIVTPAATTVYTVSAVNAGNCTASTSTVTIHVGALNCNPVLPLIKNICLGDTASLQLAPTFGEQPLTYLWSNGSTDSVAKVSPTTTNTYNVIVTDACGSSCSTTFTVIVVSPPSISLTSSIPGNTICGTGTIIWTASSSATTPVYSWSPATNLSATSGSVVQVVNPTASTTYTIQVTDNTTTCKSSTIATVAYNAPIYVSATAGNPWVCPNTTFTMYASDTVNTNFPLLNSYCVTGLHTFAQPCITNVSINGNSFSSPSGCTTPAFTPATSTPVANVYAGSVLTLTATTGANPFSGTAKVAVWIDFDRDGILKASEYQLIQAIVTPGVPDTLLINVPINAAPGNTLMRFRTRSGSIDVAGLACSAFASGETEDYNINIIGVNPTMNTYTWSNGVTAQGYTVSGGLATTTTYTVTASTTAGCSTTTALTISVAPVQISSISNLGDVCLGETRVVKAQASFGNGSFTYDWQPMSDILVAAGDSAELIPFSNVTYTLTVTDGCGATASSTFLVNANFPPSIFGLPSVPGVCQNGIISLSAGGASTYSWTPNTFLNTNIGSPVLVVNPTSDMTYTVVGTDALGCTASATVPILYSVPFNVNINFDSTAVCAGQPITLKVSDTFAVNNSVAIAACASAANVTNSEDIVFANFTNLTQSNNSSYALACGIAAGGPGSVGGSYSNFSNATTVPTYYNRDSISFTLVKNNCLVNNNNYGLKIWIDYNRDGDYLDPNEIVFVSTLQNAADTIKGVFKIPNFVQAGKSTMRVVMRATNNVSSITSCGTYLDGETEDYPVNLVNVFNFATTSISWAPNTNPLQGQTVQATPTVPTIYTVTLVDNAGCTASSTLFVNTNPLTAAPITRAKSGNICLGAIDTLTANPLGGSPPYNYAWSTSATTKNISVTPTSATTYTVVITDACNATTSQTVTVGIQPWPTISISANPASASLCTSGTVTLNATCATCALMVWENNGSSNPTAVITPQYSEVYTVVGTDGVGCTNSETIFVNRSYDHVFNFTPVSANICGGDSIALSFVDSTLGVGVQTLPSGYCIPSHTTGTPCITSFIFNQINNSPANNCGTNPVTTYTNTTTVLAGTTVPLFMSFANTTPTTSNAVAAVWIDFNRDGLFSASEFTSLGTNIAPNNTVGLNVNIPNFASAGLTKMRVRIKSIGTAINPLDACVNFPNGSTQDYTLNIVGKVPATNMVYDWQPSTNLSNNSLPNVTATNLSATTIFTVTAVAAGSCTYTVTKTVVVNPKVSFAPTIVNNQCSDGTSGLIVLNPAGGTSPINYTILPNVGNFIGPDSFKNLPSGVYTISSSDVVGCSNSTTVTIGAPAPIAGSLNLVGSLCTASQPVNVYATITGGTAPYSFSWFDNAFLPISYATSALGDTVYNVLPPSELNLLYSDANGCQNSVSPFLFLNLALPSTPLSIGFVSATSPSCFGSTNGTITVQAFGGNNSLNGYQFKLNSSSYQSAATFTNVAAGTYTITVLDDNLCTQSLTYTLTEPSILVDSVVATNVKCFGASNGTISHFVQGGTAPFTIFVNSSAPVANYNIGTYNVFVQDANGCTFTTTVSITQPTNLTVIASQDSVICNGGSTGSINASATGGNGGYAYFVNGNPIASGYAAGTYTVQVADVENCTKTTTVTVLQPSIISLNLSVTQPTCSGTNGNILATATGGTGALNYTLNGGAFASSQVPGTYTICAIDMKSCSVCSTVTITNPPTLNLAATAVGPGCGTLLGEITPTATGGSTPYTFFVNGNAYLSGNVYSPNNYTVSVVDNNNCQSTLLVVVPIGTSPLLNNTTANDITCVGKVDGSFNFAASGGTNAGYTYTVNGNTPVANYSAGTYTVTVNDLTSCTVTKILTINNAQPWAVTATGTAALCNGNLGSVTAITNGGATPIDYSINGQPISNGFLAGTYTIVANDANSCSKTTIVTVGAAPAPIVISTSVSNPTCANGIGSIIASASGGSGNIAITIDSLAPATSYAPGIYTVMAIDNNACAVTSTVTIASTSNAISITSVASDPLCNAGTGVITNTIVGGVAPIDITVGGLPFDTNYVSGTYTIVATDINSCSATTSVTINPGPSPIVITSNVTQPTCINGFGAVTVTASGGANGISLLIGNAPIALSYPVGVYTIDAVDNSGCTATDVLVVAASSASISIATSSATPTCFGNVAAVSATANGGTPPLSLTIGGQPLNATYASGNYIVVATDNVGCTTSASLIVPPAPLPLNLTLNGVDPLCKDSMGAILATSSGGTSPLNLFEGSNFFASPHLPGTYTITLIDANSCSTTSSVVINPAPIFEISASISSISICNQNSAIATSSIVGSNPQSITWSNGIQEGTAFVPSFGTNIYTVTATTANCFTSSTVALTVNAGSGILSQAMLSNVLSTPGTSCNTLLQVDGDTVNYTDFACNLIASVFDPSGGNLLDSLVSCVSVLNTVDSVNNIVFAPRVYKLTPKNNGAANITLYYTNDDLLEYNNHVLTNLISVDTFQTKSSVNNLVNGQSIPGLISKFSDEFDLMPDSIIQVNCVWNSALQHWEVNFNVPSFSVFRLHTSSNAAPLALNLLHFKGEALQNANHLVWRVNKEENMQWYKVERSFDGNNFTFIGQVKANNLLSQSEYIFDDKDIRIGKVYYRLKMTEFGGNFDYSNTIMLSRESIQQNLEVYPNPVGDELHFTYSTNNNVELIVRLIDVSGRTVRIVNTEVISGKTELNVDVSGLAAGTYVIQATEKDGNITRSQFTKAVR